MSVLSRSMWDLVPWPGIDSGPQALGAQSPSHWEPKKSWSWFVITTQGCWSRTNFPNLYTVLFTFQVKNPPANAREVRDAGSIPGSERSPGGGHGNPLHYSCLENPLVRGAWRAAAHGVAKSPTQLRRLSMNHTLCSTQFLTFLLLNFYIPPFTI